MDDEKVIDDAFKAKAEEIKAVVTDIANAERGIARHQQGIAALTRTLVLAYYLFGRLLLGLPGATGELKKARSAWCKRAIQLAGTKDRVYRARDICRYFDAPTDSKIRASGTTGEERARTFQGTIGELEQLIKSKKYNETEARRLERIQQWREDQEAANRRDLVVVQDTASRFMAPSMEEEDDAIEPEFLDVQAEPVVEAQVPTAGDDDRIRKAEDNPKLPVADASIGETVEDDRRARVASELVDLFGGGVKEAVRYLIGRRWNLEDALKWLQGLVDEERKNAPKPAKTAWPPPITCWDGSGLDKVQAGQYVTLGTSSVMVVGQIGKAEIVLENPFHPRGMYPISVPRDEWDQVKATTEERVRSEFARLELKLPGEAASESDADGKQRAARKIPAKRGKSSIGRKRPVTEIAVAGA